MSDEKNELRELARRICIATKAISIDHRKGDECPRCDAIVNALAALSVEGERELTDKERNYLNKFYDKAYGRGEAKAKDNA